MADTETTTEAPATPAPSTSTADSTTKVSPDARLIFGLMLWTGAFALVGHELKTTSAASSVKTDTTTGPKIILGVFAATAILTMVSHAGDAGRQFAVGLATIAAVSSSLVFGAPVWKALSGVLATQGPGGVASTPTGSTTPTVPTTGTGDTAVALSQAA
jgi:hypothetical protein